MGSDWRDSQIRYLVHFDDGGSGMRHRAVPLTVGAELADGDHRYRVERVEPPANPNAFGHAWGNSDRLGDRRQRIARRGACTTCITRTECPVLTRVTSRKRIAGSAEACATAAEVPRFNLFDLLAGRVLGKGHWVPHIAIKEGRMKGIRSFTAVLACVAAIAVTTVAAAQADPSNFGTTTWTFTNCTGPAGTPTTFDAVRQEFTTPNDQIVGMPAIFLSTDGTALFNPFMVTNLDTGASGTNTGFTHNNLLLVTCNTTSPVTGTHYLFTGFLTPVGTH